MRTLVFWVNDNKDRSPCHWCCVALPLWLSSLCLLFTWAVLHSLWASQVAQTVNNLPEVRETQVGSLDREDPLQKEMATHSSILAWRIPWTEEPDSLQPMGLQGVGHYWETNTFTFARVWGRNWIIGSTWLKHHNDAPADHGFNPKMWHHWIGRMCVLGRGERERPSNTINRMLRLTD